jgi:hypothetical protein
VKHVAHASRHGHPLSKQIGEGSTFSPRIPIIMHDLPPVPDEIFQRRWPGGFTLRDEANAIVAYAFRNGPNEDLHAGKYSELLEQAELSRITEAEMKELMIIACDKMEELLRCPGVANDHSRHSPVFDAFKLFVGNQNRHGISVVTSIGRNEC